MTSRDDAPAARSRKQTVPQQSKATLSGVTHSVWNMSLELCTPCNKRRTCACIYSTCRCNEHTCTCTCTCVCVHVHTYTLRYICVASMDDETNVFRVLTSFIQTECRFNWKSWRSFKMTIAANERIWRRICVQVRELMYMNDHQRER